MELKVLIMASLFGFIAAMYHAPEWRLGRRVRRG
ncbi:hypothetical protein RHODGE_RHODGE_00030 [Rhodoplanes serenus]|jgi:hypothetical protein|uniref:Uncharacterized protein n=1 Tax=Rhodoplanes serenus TaxID=200615 RepID=A0A447CP62_9BRAD|nr:hypothetical protein RHODGE_RHODGE_00030 [Rhodoplanes serenus]